MPFQDNTFDFTLEEIEREVRGMRLSRLNEMMVRWSFMNMLLKSAYSIDKMKTVIAQTPFGKSRIDVNGIGFQVWLEK